MESSRRRYKSPEESFAARTAQQGECLIWTGQLTRTGYGVIAISSKPYAAHRYAWERVNGPIPEGMEVDHMCHNKACCALEHLRLTGRKQNGENLSGAKKSSKSGVRGVCWETSRKKWLVQVMHNRKNYKGGRFDSLEEAEAAAIALRNRLFTHNDLDR